MKKKAKPVKPQSLDFDWKKWAGGIELPADLQHRLQELWSQAQQPSDDGCWTFQGTPMPKEDVMTHWGHRPNFFNSGVQDLRALEKLQKEGGALADLPALFYFDRIQMRDEEDDEEFELSLGSYVHIKEGQLDANGEEVDTEYIARVTAIMFTANSERLVAIRWMYRGVDTPLAAPVKPTKEGHRGPEYKRLLPVTGEVFPRSRLWLCGSEHDNTRYGHVYQLMQIDRPCRVFHVPPGVSDPEEVRELLHRRDPSVNFDPEADFFYNQFTVRDFMTFEDIFEDYSPWSPKYKEVWEREGNKGILALRGPLSPQDKDGGCRQLMELSRGEAKRQLNHPVKRELHMLELFAGGGGLSYMAQSNENISITTSWANDINYSAAATYTANHPTTFMSCCGLEEFLQLCLKWKDVLEQYLGPNWQQALPQLVQLPPGKRFSRTHMPEGVGCAGGNDAHSTEAAARGQAARETLLDQLQSRLQQKKQQLKDSEEGEEEAGDQLKQDIAHLKQLLGVQQRYMKHYQKWMAGGVSSGAAAAGEPDWEGLAKALPQCNPQLLLPASSQKLLGTASIAAADAEKLREVGKVLLAATGLAEQPPADLVAATAAGATGAAAGAAKQQNKNKLRGKKQQQPPLQQDEEEEKEGAGVKQQNKNKQGSKKKSSEQKLTPSEAYVQAFNSQLDTVIGNLQDIVTDKKWRKVLEVRDVHIHDCAVRVKHGSSKNQTSERLTSYECWLEFEVRREGDSEWRWEHQAVLQLSDAVKPLRLFLLRMVADKTIPQPGDVQVLTGGPPCQNVSGLNRHTKQADVLNDPKNRLVASYMNLIDFLQPNYILMEQVTAVFVKEQALYARYALLRMLQQGYQARVGICTAGNYGTPQGRRRAIFWGALSGKEQLPPFPLPTHECKDFNQGYPKAADFCRVEFGAGDRDPQAAPYPMCVWGDVCGDLPHISNYYEGDRLHYLGKPTSVWQQFLRRQPLPNEPPLIMRAVHADAAMRPWQDPVAAVLEDARQGEQELTEIEKALLVGGRAFCQKGKAKQLQTLEPESKSDKMAGKVAKKQPNKAQAKAQAKEEDEDADEAEESEGEGEEPSKAEEGEGDGVNEPQGDAADGGDGGDDDDDEEDSPEERANLAEEKKNSKVFAQDTWLAHKKATAEGDPEVEEALELMLEANMQMTAFTLGMERLKLQQAASTMDEFAPLRDHRAMMCNADDEGRMRAVPKQEGSNFRSMPGVINHQDGSCCSGSWHAARYVKDAEQKKELAARVKKWQALSKAETEKRDPMKFVFDQQPKIKTECLCLANGVPPKPPKGLLARSGNHKEYRVDMYDKNGWRGSAMDRCDSKAFFLGTGDLVCPRWCVTYKQGQSNGRNGCFGRIRRDVIQPTVVTRAEPHNLQLIHHAEDRVVSIRENARSQGFPDFHVFVGLGTRNKGSHGKGTATVDERYLQIGNAVAPVLASALGRCLLLAAQESAPLLKPVVKVPDPEYAAAAVEATRGGAVHYSTAHKVDKGAPDYWSMHGVQKFKKGKRAAADEPEAQNKRRKVSNKQAAAAETGAPEAAVTDTAAPTEPVVGRSAAAGTSKGKACKRSTDAAATTAKAAEAAAEDADEEVAPEPAAGPSKGIKAGRAKRSKDAPPPADTEADATAHVKKQPAGSGGATRNRSSSKPAAAKASRSSPIRRSSRAAATAATAAMRVTLAGDSDGGDDSDNDGDVLMEDRDQEPQEQQGVVAPPAAAAAAGVKAGGSGEDDVIVIDSSPDASGEADPAAAEAEEEEEGGEVEGTSCSEEEEQLLQESRDDGEEEEEEDESGEADAAGAAAEATSSEGSLEVPAASSDDEADDDDDTAGATEDEGRATGASSQEDADEKDDEADKAEAAGEAATAATRAAAQGDGVHSMSDSAEMLSAESNPASDSW